MRLPPDTHTFPWFIAASTNLSEYVRTLIEAPSNERLLSIARLYFLQDRAYHKLPSELDEPVNEIIEEVKQMAAAYA